MKSGISLSELAAKIEGTWGVLTAEGRRGSGARLMKRRLRALAFSDGSLTVFPEQWAQNKIEAELYQSNRNESMVHRHTKLVTVEIEIVDENANPKS